MQSAVARMATTLGGRLAASFSRQLLLLRSSGVASDVVALRSSALCVRCFSTDKESKKYTHDYFQGVSHYKSGVNTQCDDLGLDCSVGEK